MLMRPSADEYHEYYGRYTALVPEGNVLETIERDTEEMLALLRSIDEVKAGYRYAPGKWSVKEVIGHLIDVERVFQYRALVFARGDNAQLPSMEQDDYVAAGVFDERPFGELIDEYRVVRCAGLALFKSFDDEMLSRRGIASRCEFSVRSIPYILAGHSIHHINVLNKRYL